MKNPYTFTYGNDSRLTSVKSIKYYNLNNDVNKSEASYDLIVSYPRSGTTNTLKNGDRVWRVGFKISNKTNVRLNLININFKENVFLHIYDLNYSSIKGPYSTELNINDSFLTEEINSDTVIVEYYVPKKYCGCNSSLKAPLNISKLLIKNEIHDIKKLSKGWNLISSVNQKLNIDYEKSTISKDEVYEFRNGKYLTVKNLEYGKAYWVRSLIDNGFINLT